MKTSLTIIATICILLSGYGAKTCYADDAGSRYRQAAELYRALDGKQVVTRKSWLDAIEQFKAVYSSYPKSVQAAKALYMTGKIYQQLYMRDSGKSDRESAIAIFRVLVKSHGKHRLADDALFLTGEIYRQDGDAANAISAYRSVLRYFPKGDMAEQASKQLDGLKPPTETEVVNVKPEKPTDDSYATLSGIRFWSSDSYARIVFDVSSMVSYRMERVPKGGSMIVDLLGTKIGKQGVGQTQKATGILGGIFLSQPEPDVTRVEIRINSPHSLSSMELANPNRIVLDISGEEPMEQSSKEAAVLPEKGGVATDDAALAEQGGAGGGRAGGAEIKQVANLKKIPAGEAAGVALAAGTAAIEAVANVAVDVAGLKKIAALEKNLIPSLEKNIDISKVGSEKNRRAVKKKSSTKKRGKPKAVANSDRLALMEAGLIPYDPSLLGVAKKKTKIKSKPAKKAAIKKEASQKPKKVAVKHRRVATLSYPSSFQGKTIVIDPGHGGKDSGAVGKGGLKEKDVVLDIGLRLRKILKKDCGCRIVMTRSRDVFIPLEQRTAIANSVNASLFISVHINASNNRKARGTETYFLSPARSKNALYTAARENMVKQSNGSTDSNDISFILSDMQNTEKINSSSLMADILQNQLIRTLKQKYRVKDKGVKTAMFYVLHGARMPSVLVETAFVSNRQEERWMRTGAFRQRVAVGLAKGINRFVADRRVATK